MAGWGFRQGIADVQRKAEGLGLPASTPEEVRAIRDRYLPALVDAKLSAMTQDQYSALVSAMCVAPEPTDLPGEVESLTITVGRNVSRDYQSWRSEMSVTVRLSPGADVEAAHAAWLEKLHTMVDNDLNNIKEN